MAAAEGAVPLEAAEGAGCIANLIQEYGVIHLTNALDTAQQQELWQLTKPYIKDPQRSATGFSGFSVVGRKSAKNRPQKRVPAFDDFGCMVFHLCADHLNRVYSNAEDCEGEPAFKHLLDLASGAKEVNMGEVQGNYYREDAVLLNHVDSDGILFTMSVALGDDCEFVIGKPTGRMKRMSERSGRERKIVMKSGDAMFFDGGSVPHQVTRMIPGTAPEWFQEQKVPNGSRCVVLFREKEECFYKTMISSERK